MTAPSDVASPAALRAVVVQPSLAQFRAPLFRALAARPGILLKVLYAASPNRPNVEPDGFEGRYAPIWRGRVLGHPIYWHAAQWSSATRAHADVLVLNWDVHYASLVPALLRAKAQGVATLLWGHGYSRHTSVRRTWPRQRIASLATALLFYNETGCRMYAQLGWDERRLFVARNSLDQGPIQAARTAWLDNPERLQQFRRERGLLDGPVLLFVSRLDRERRVDLLLHAARRLSEQFRTLQVVVIGQGPIENELRALSATLQPPVRVRFVGPVYEEMELAPWFLSADVFCYPAHMGLSLLHAFGYGLPVVTADRIPEHGPEIEALTPGVNGSLYASGDANAMAKQVRVLLENEDLRRQMSREARRTVLEQFSMPCMVNGFEAALRLCATKAGLRRRRW